MWLDSMNFARKVQFSKEYDINPTVPEVLSLQEKHILKNGTLTIHGCTRDIVERVALAAGRVLAPERILVLPAPADEQSVAEPAAAMSDLGPGNVGENADANVVDVNVNDVSEDLFLDDLFSIAEKEEVEYMIAGSFIFLLGCLS